MVQFEHPRVIHVLVSSTFRVDYRVAFNLHHPECRKREMLHMAC